MTIEEARKLGSGSISIPRQFGTENAPPQQHEKSRNNGNNVLSDSYESEDDKPWRGITGTPAEPIWALVCGLDPRVGRHRRISVQVAYIDESKSSNLLMAGFISTVEKWADFSEAWKKELDRPPAIPFFHMKEVLREKGGIFDEVPMQDRIDKVKKLIAVVNDWADVDFSCWMKLESYNRILKPTLNAWKKLKKFDQPYLWQFVVGVLEGMSSLEIYGRKGNRIQFVFDQNETLFDNARKRYEELFSKLDAFAEARAIVDGVDERDDKIVLPLQAADLLAWNINRASSKPLPEKDPLKGYEMAVSNLELLRSVKRESWTLKHKEEALRAAARAITTTIILGPSKHRRSARN
jgi:hypothetical protein